MRLSLVRGITPCLALAVIALAVPGVALSAPALVPDDCAKCHDQPPADIARAGAAHKDDVSCTDCHESHKPKKAANIPACSQCHSGSAHYGLKGCNTCHANPHAPLEIKLANNLTEPCLSCHEPQIKQLREQKSKHTLLFCTGCHAEHRKVPMCLKCHKPHSADQVQADCSKCHKAHQPSVVTYGETLVNKDCAGCHKKAFDLIAATETKHKTVACVKCHPAKHKTVPTCQSCHGSPHPAGMMVKYGKCTDCHNIAHDINHFTAAAKPGVAPAKVPAAAPAVAPKP